MLDVVNNKIAKVGGGIFQFRDEMLSEYHSCYINNLTSKELDREFNRDLYLLVKSLSKLSKEDRNVLLDVLSRFIDCHIKNKVEKEIDTSFKKVFKI